jgi:hypothetical protein
MTTRGRSVKILELILGFTRADRYAANVLPIIREAQRAGARTPREIADALNARGIATARGGQWYAQSVANILGRA